MRYPRLEWLGLGGGRDLRTSACRRPCVEHTQHMYSACCRVSSCLFYYKNSSGYEIANLNFYAVRPGSYRNSLKYAK